MEILLIFNFLPDLSLWIFSKDNYLWSSGFPSKVMTWHVKVFDGEEVSQIIESKHHLGGLSRGFDLIRVDSFGLLVGRNFFPAMDFCFFDSIKIFDPTVLCSSHSSQGRRQGSCSTIYGWSLKIFICKFSN